MIRFNQQEQKVKIMKKQTSGIEILPNGMGEKTYSVS